MNRGQRQMIPLARALLLGLALAGAAGCATVVTGSHQKVPIASDPPGAAPRMISWRLGALV